MRFLFILLFSATLFAGEWTINDFTIRGKQFTQSATGILQGNLNRIPSYKAPKGDELLLRRRLDVNNYGLYIGKAEASAYTNLSRFTKPAGMGMDKLLKTKFYKAKTPTGFDDVMDIYVQGEYIYVQNLVRIFYKDGGVWKSLEVAQGKKPGVLEISSTPRGATVTVDGVVKGKTPYTFVMDAPTVEVEVSMAGYYSQSFTADAKPGVVKNVSPALKKRVTFSSNIEPEKMLDTTIQDIDQALEVLHSIEGVYENEKGREATSLLTFERSYPTLKPQGEFEYDHEFAKRKAEYEDKKQKALADAKINSSSFQTTISIMSEHIDHLSAKLYDLYLPVNSMKLGRYEINQNRFPVTLSINQGAFQFTYKGYLMMNRDVAKLFKFSSDEKGLKLQYSKRKVKVSGKQYYVYYEGMHIPFQGEIYELQGELTLPSVVVNNKDYKTYIHSVKNRVAKEKVIKNSLAFLQRKQSSGDEFAALLLAQLHIERSKGYEYATNWEDWLNDLGESVANKKHFFEHYKAVYADLTFKPSLEKALEIVKTSIEKSSSSQAMVFMGYMYYEGFGVKKDSILAKEWFTKSVSLQNASGMCWLGSLAFIDGDYTNALKWYRKSADLGHSLGICYLGEMYEFGYGVESDYKKALALYQKSLKLGCSQAMTDLGYMYLYGNGVENDYKKAADLFQKSSDMGNSEGMIGLGIMHKSGFHFPRNYRDAFSWFNKSVKLDNINALNHLGILYQEGQGVTRDYKKALQLYMQSADKGSALGMFNVAYTHENGLGVPKDDAKALEWYKKSAGKGDSYAPMIIGDYYQFGYGVRKDFDKALEWYKKGAAKNNGAAMSAIGNMYRLGVGMKKDNRLALEWYNKGAALNNPEAMYYVGYMYNQGIGVEKNKSVAFEWHKKSAALNNRSAMYSLGLYYEYGTAVSKNWQEAKKWYAKAAKLGSKSAIKKCKEKGISY